MKNHEYKIGFSDNDFYRKLDAEIDRIIDSRMYKSGMLSSYYKAEIVKPKIFQETKKGLGHGIGRFVMLR